MDRRFRAHQSGHGAKYTRSHYPLRKKKKKKFEDPSAARKREYAIKHMTRKEKEDLVAGRLKKEGNL